MWHRGVGLIVLQLCMSLTIVLGAIEETNTSKSPLTPNVYVKLLRAKRREHRILIQKMIHDDYSKNFKKINLALDKIFEVIKRSNQTLLEHSYTTEEGFPTEVKKQEAVALLLENTCLAADLILHFPDIAYRLLAKFPDWKDTINWCIEFVSKFPHITDELVAQLMDLVYQEVNEHARTPDFINPYRKKVDNTESAVKKPKTLKKITKGPRLTKTEL